LYFLQKAQHLTIALLQACWEEEMLTGMSHSRPAVASVLTKWPSDIFYVAKEPDLFPISHEKAASYDGADPFTLPDNRSATIGDVCDFVVNYIGSDVLVCRHPREGMIVL
jgi:hypothetical protein